MFVKLLALTSLLALTTAHRDKLGHKHHKDKDYAWIEQQGGGGRYAVSKKDPALPDRFWLHTHCGCLFCLCPLEGWRRHGNDLLLPSTPNTIAPIPAADASTKDEKRQMQTPVQRLPPSSPPAPNQPPKTWTRPPPPGCINIRRSHSGKQRIQVPQSLEPPQMGRRFYTQVF